MDQPHPLPDMQNSADARNIAIDKVGVRNVQYPIVVLDRTHERQHSIGTFTLTVDLPHHFKGTHMSRFLEVLNEHRNEVSVQGLPGEASLRQFPFRRARRGRSTGSHR